MDIEQTAVLEALYEADAELTAAADEVARLKRVIEEGEERSYRLNVAKAVLDGEYGMLSRRAVPPPQRKVRS